MIKSMTGFGRSEVVTDERKITIELKSVNHRYLDLSIKMPRKLVFLEGAIRNLMKTYMQRGKVDVFITYEDYTLSCGALKYNKELAGEYLAYIRQMAEEFGIENDVRVSALSRYPEIFTMEEGSEDTDELWKGLKKALDGAVDGFVTTRTAEGEHLREDILAKLDGILEMVAFIEERSPKIVAEYREKLEAKVKELLEDTQIEENRIAAEVVIYADKICTDEEVVRLKSHVVHMKETLQSDEAGIGRKLDFIAQEMNREANTILSKANDLEVSNTGIGLKTEIEKVREQIQNIE